jgi:hypothetical protein
VYLLHVYGSRDSLDADCLIFFDKKTLTVFKKKKKKTVRYLQSAMEIAWLIHHNLVF